MQQRLTGYNLVSFINQLDKNRVYNYVNPSTRAQIRIMRVDLPGGPIIIKRWDPSKGETEAGAREASISKEMIWRVANALFDGQPINIDRILAGSYNTRSVLESLLVAVANFEAPVLVSSN